MPQQMSAATHRQPQHQVSNLQQSQPPMSQQQIASTSSSVIIPQQQQQQQSKQIHQQQMPVHQSPSQPVSQQSAHAQKQQNKHATPPSVQATASEKAPTRQYETALKAAERAAAVSLKPFLNSLEIKLTIINC